MNQIKNRVSIFFTSELRNFILFYFGKEGELVK